MKAEHELRRLDRNDMSMMRWMCGLVLSDRQIQISDNYWPLNQSAV